MNSELQLLSIPQPLVCDTDSGESNLLADGTLEMSAAPQTDLFIDPRGITSTTNSVRLLFQPDGVFTLSARAQGDLRSTYDAAVLILYVDGAHWAKLCLELSSQGQPMIVSVVTNGVSDDCNSVVLEGPEAHLRIAGMGTAFAFHYSLDGKFWHFVRYFTLKKRERLCAGFSAQSPTGDGCTVRFTNIQYQVAELEDLRSGI